MTAHEKYQVGDRVVLGSGGPTMMVETANTTHLGCVWFTEDGLAHRDSFRWECVSPAGGLAVVQ